MKVEIPIMGRDKVIKEALERTPMPTEGWLDITDGINAKFAGHLLAGAVVAILEDFRKMGVRDIEVILTAEASGNVLALLGEYVCRQFSISREDVYSLTFRKTEATEIPMFDLFRSVRSASHKDMIKVLSVRKEFVAEKKVLMIDDVLRDGGTGEAIKKMVEEVKGKFLGLGVIFRKMWLAPEQLEKLGKTPIVSLIDVASPYPEEYERFRRREIQKINRTL
ncbi:hypothetical protein KJA17_00520 [Patescibacteria group bacterium]|nr:hypothetical protein [Patescibacteria group bacterium]